MKKNLSAKLLGVIAVLFAASALCNAGANAPALDPVRYTEANATATAIAPAIVPTVRYNAEVLPELQRVEREEITETTRNRYEHERSVDTVGAIARQWMIGAFAVCIVMTCVGGGVWIGGTAAASGVRKMREATLPLTRLLPEGPHVTEYGTLVHTATMAVATLDAPQDAQPEHARLVSATYQAMPPGLLDGLLARQRGAWVEVESEQRLLT